MLESVLVPRKHPPDLCRLLECPQRPVLREAVGQTVRVLERTKAKFKSKDLKDLRVRLEGLLENSNNSCQDAQSCARVP